MDARRVGVGLAWLAAVSAIALVACDDSSAVKEVNPRTDSGLPGADSGPLPGMDGGGPTLPDGAPSDCCEGMECLRGKDAAGRKALGLCRAPCKQTSDCGRGECCASAEGIAGSFCGPSDLCRSMSRQSKPSSLPP